MDSVICKQGDTRPGRVTVTLERGEAVIVFKGVPAQVCENCGEYYLDEAVSAELLSRAEEAVQHGAEVEVFRFAA